MALSDDAFFLVVPPLRLTFRRDGERWTHEVAVGETTIAFAVESQAGRDDPTRVVSPAYQQVHVQNTPARGDQALLVGEWGSHHCSAVFSVKRESSRSVIEADVAVRTRAEIQSLASTYSVLLTSSALEDADTNAITWGLDPPIAGRLRFESDGPTHVGLAEAGRQKTRVQANAEVVPEVATQRMLYRWCWLGDPVPLTSIHGEDAGSAGR